MKSRYAVWTLCAAFSGFLTLGAYHEPQGKPATPNATMLVGEELTYNVSYLSVDIGQVRITVRPDTAIAGRKYYRAVAHIDSYKGIPFVDLHAIYETRMSEDVHAVWFHSKNKQDDLWRQFTYDFDYPNHVIHVDREEYGGNQVIKKDTLRVDTLYQDGLSLFYFARKNVRSNMKYSVPTIVSENRGVTEISFSSESGEEEIDAIKYPVNVVHFEGQAGFVGIFGLTGGFEGWFSNDAAQVPILAKMKVILGSVRIELLKWRREGWEPPKFGEGK